MKQLKSNIKNKIKSKAGMTLTEILVTVIIMLLATGVLTTVVSLGVNQYTKTVSNSEANTLMSTLESVMTNELAYTTEIHVDGDGNVTEFQSQNYAIEKSLSTFFITDKDTGGYGKVLIGSDDENLNLLGKGAYPKSIGVKIDSFIYDNDSHTFTITISIGCKSTNYVTKTFQVINVNKTKATT